MHRPSILIIDRDPTIFDTIKVLLSCQCYQFNYAHDGESGLLAIEQWPPDLILLSFILPNLNGIELCQRIKAMPEGTTIPIMMMTNQAVREKLILSLAAGADDFIGKPFNRRELRVRVQALLRIRQQYQRLESFTHHLTEIIEDKMNELQRVIYHDELTDLPSRQFILNTLTELLASGYLPCAVVYLDCNEFTLINASYGYIVGDQLLREIAKRLQLQLRIGDVLARMGEDKFCFVLAQIENVKALDYFIDTIRHSLDTPFLIEGNAIYLTASIGGALGSEITQSPEELLQNAYIAMYQAKGKEKGCYQIFKPHMQQLMVSQITLERDLCKAFEQEDFFLCYQPIIYLQTQKIEGFEALIRWCHPKRGMVPPSEFIPLMETSGLINPVGLRVLRVACQQLALWQIEGWRHLTMSVNLSMRQFSYPKLLDEIDRILNETGVNPACLKLEITESTVMTDPQQSLAIIKELQSRQIHISIDDFGTGYSSLEQLHYFAVDSIKIDRSFVLRLQQENVAYHIIDMILSLGKELGLSVIAEGIETSSQLQRLKLLNCELGQGYFFAPPLATDAIERQFLANALI